VPTLAFALLEVIAALLTIAAFVLLMPGLLKLRRLNRDFNREESWPTTARQLPLSKRFSLSWQLLRGRVTEPDPDRAAHLAAFADYLLRKRATLDAHNCGITFQQRFYLLAAVGLSLQGISIIAQGATFFDTAQEEQTRTLVTLAGIVMVACSIILLVLRTVLRRVDNRDRAVCQAVLDAHGGFFASSSTGDRRQADPIPGLASPNEATRPSRPRRVVVAAALTVMYAAAVVGMAITLLWQMLTGTGGLGEQHLHPMAEFAFTTFALLLIAFAAILIAGARRAYAGRGRGVLVVPLLVFIAIGSIGEVHDIMGTSSTRSNIIGAAILVLAAIPVMIVYTRSSTTWFSRMR
jgi:hypothetical protein